MRKDEHEWLNMFQLFCDFAAKINESLLKVSSLLV
jgi:hypothetical protein